MPSITSGLSPAALAAACEKNEGVQALTVATVLFFISILVVGLRFYARIHVHRSIGLDDYLIVLSLVIGGVAFALYVKLFASGMGRHIYCLSRYQISQVAKWTLLSQIFISINLGLTKISICALVLRVIDRSHKRFSQFIWALIIFVTVTHIAQLILFLTQCRPVEANWNPSVGGNCFSERITYSVAYLNFSLDCFSDLACAAIPIYVIQRLQLKRRIKIALCFLMSLGVFTAGCVIASAITLRGAFETDFTVGLTESSMWAAIGAFAGIIVASLPALSHFLHNFLNGFSQAFSRLRSSSSYSFPATGQHAFSGLFRSIKTKRGKDSAGDSNGTTQVNTLPHEVTSVIIRTTNINTVTDDLESGKPARLGALSGTVYKYPHAW